MSEYTAKIEWQRGDQAFLDNRYSRGHSWTFDGGAVVEASASPHVVPLPMSVESGVDPEEAFVASLSSCHMLFFLAIAAKRKYRVESYVDDAIGVMEIDGDSKMSMTTVTLRPRAVFAAERRPTAEQIDKMHHQAHQQCFIANSVKTTILVKPAA